MIDLLRIDILRNLDYSYRNMKIEVGERRYRLDIEYSQERGVIAINQKARNIKRKIYSQYEQYQPGEL